MVKLGKAFSILVVFALLILLAPAVILAPPLNVAQASTTYNLTVNVTPSGGGNVTVNGTMPLNYPNTTTWNASESVTLNAIAASGYAFVNWSGDLTDSINPTNITMNDNYTITANFVVTYNLTVGVTPGGGGNVTVNGITPPSYPNITTWNAGENLTLHARQTCGYSFVNWSGDLTGSITPTNITMNSDKSVTANFNFTPGVVQEVEASFTFNETVVDPWETFVAGSAGIDDTYGLCLEQFTREHVVILNTTPMPVVPGCGYRNYTSSNGTVSGDLSGTLWMQYHTVLFNKTYNLTQQYDETATKFGWMVGRGRFTDGSTPSDNFTFTMFIDFDSNDDMTDIAGKGFLLSVEENGRFGNMANDPELRHKLIGDFTISKTGITYNGDFHLRDYPPDEVFYRGWVNVSGMVKQERLDPIRVGLNLVNWMVDGPHPTPIAPAPKYNIATAFEEIEWGKDPPKWIVTSDYMGTGGEMNISRNTILYLNIMPLDNAVRIQGTAGCNLKIDDTYAVTDDDNTAHGIMFYLLPLYIPDQELQFTLFFNQSGYTFSPFGLLNSNTECYAGQEYFADAYIEIESVQLDADQNSWDQAYGLYPHPNLTGINPSSGYVGETLDVTISGKYLLRADDYDTNTGSVSLGPNITVNSYWFKNSSPFDNEIIARITIDPGAGTVEEDVNVTSCFGYAGGQGTGPYLSGELNGFTVKALENSTLQSDVTYIGGAEGLVTCRVKLFEAGTNWNPANLSLDGTTISDTAGTSIISNLAADTYDIGIKGPTCLSESNTSVTLSSTTVVPFFVLEGDADDDDYVGGGDFSLFSIGYDTWPGVPGWDPRCDFDRDNYLGGGDFSLFSMNYDNWGDLLGKVVF